MSNNSEEEKEQVVAATENSVAAIENSDIKDLITLITQQQYLTPSGPSAEGPVNKPQFDALASKLQTILSALNKTS